MVIYEKRDGVPKFVCIEFEKKKNDYALLIPVINEGNRIKSELERAKEAGVSNIVDVIICDGDSSDGSTDAEILQSLDVNTLLIKKDEGRQGAQLRMGISWALERGYKGIITIDGNNKDSIEDVRDFVSKLKEGYDFVQGSRYVKGGRGINTPFFRAAALRMIHAPIISLTAHYKFTDTTNAFRAYSAAYLTDERVQPLRDVFVSYELLAFLSVRASQIGLRVCEIPVTRTYPFGGKIPTKISFFKGNWELLRILMKNSRGDYNPDRQ